MPKALRRFIIVSRDKVIDEEIGGIAGSPQKATRQSMSPLYQKFGLDIGLQVADLCNLSHFDIDLVTE